MKQSKPTAQKFGTFLGVYTPSILTILGLIMYLRFGWVVGNVGLGLTLLIVVLASSITFITGLSASAIATNIQVGVGGEYYLVSRSLGIEPGGAIGIPLYLCRTLSVTFYCFGLAEAILVLWPAEWGMLPSYAIQLLAAGLIIVVTLLAGRSASLALKAQLPLMVLVGLSLLALVIGVLMNDLHAPVWTPSYHTAPEGFWYVFAVFFPAVTGFTAGIGMSGDLKDPRKSIPTGTLGAVLTGLIIYLIIPVFLSITAALSLEQLADPQKGLSTWTEVAILGAWLVIPAVWGAILSSAFGSILGGPRVLQALSMDGLAPKLFSKLSISGQPTVATWTSGIIALLAVSLGELNTIAQFVSVLFLTLYVAINLSAAVEQLVAEPSYRPQIKVPWYVSILGALGAIGVMYLINPWACLIALVLEFSLYLWLRSRSLEQQWGDVGAGLWLNFSRYSMLQLAKRKIHPRNWRPLMLLFVQDIEKRMPLVRLAEALGQNHGILTIAKLLFTKEEKLSAEKRKNLEMEMAESLKRNGLEAFCEVHAVDELADGIHDVSKAHGLAGLRTNTIVFGWSEGQAGQLRQLEICKDIAENGKNLLLVRFTDQLPESCKRIDIWWGGRENNGDLMLLLAYLLQLNRQWEQAEITIRSVVQSAEESDRLKQGILQALPKTRIKAKVEVLHSQDTFGNLVYRHSSNADIVFLGLPQLQQGRYEQMATNIDKLSKDLRVTVFVQNNSMPDTTPILLKI